MRRVVFALLAAAAFVARRRWNIHMDRLFLGRDTPPTSVRWYPISHGVRLQLMVAQWEEAGIVEDQEFVGFVFGHDQDIRVQQRAGRILASLQ